MHPFRPLRFLSPARRRFAAVLAGGVLLAAASTASAASNIYVKFSNAQGSYAGESQATGHVGCCEAYSLSFGASSTSTGTGAGKPTFSPVSLVKKTDRLSPILFYDLASGTTIPADSTSNSGTDVTIDFVQSSGNAALLMRVELKSVYVTAQSSSAAEGADDYPSESVDLTYGAIRITYYPVDASGNSTGSPVVGSWSIIASSSTY